LKPHDFIPRIWKLCLRFDVEPSSYLALRTMEDHGLEESTNLVRTFSRTLFTIDRSLLYESKFESRADKLRTIEHKLLVKALSCRFVISDVVEGQVTADEGYSIFEPTVAFEIKGKDVFNILGIEGAKNTVIMHFREQAIEKTVVSFSRKG